MDTRREIVKIDGALYSIVPNDRSKLNTAFEAGELPDDRAILVSNLLDGTRFMFEVEHFSPGRVSIRDGSVCEYKIKHTSEERIFYQVTTGWRTVSAKIEECRYPTLAELKFYLHLSNTI